MRISDCLSQNNWATANREEASEEEENDDEEEAFAQTYFPFD